MGSKFFPYHPNTNNCQDFIKGVLLANGINDQKAIDFVKQDTSVIFKNKGWLSGMAKQVTDLGGYADVIMQGGAVKELSNQLTDKEIDGLVKHFEIKKFHGCYIDDRLPQKLIDGFYVINLNGKSHWCALCKDGKSFFYFDSYGFPASEEVEEEIGEYIHSDVQIQAIESTSCGFFCIAFMKSLDVSRNKKKAYADFLKRFDKDPRKNEVVLHELLEL